MKAVCLGLKPGAAGWKSQPNPLNYGGTPHFCFLPDPLRNLLFKSDVVVCMTVNKHNLLDETFFPTKNIFNHFKANESFVVGQSRKAAVKMYWQATA